MNTNDGIFEAKLKLPDDVCQSIIKLFEKSIIDSSTLRQHGEHHYGGTLQRKDVAIYLDDTGSELQGVVNDYLNKAISEYTDIFNALRPAGGIYPEITLRSIRQKIQKTVVGGGYHVWHFEDATWAAESNRVLAWTIYLNDVEEGGETEFLYHSKRIKAEQGKISIFPANFLATHRGNPPISGVKYILTGWYTIS